MRVFQLLVMPFRVGNAPAVFRELMNKVLYQLRSRPMAQELIERRAPMEAHNDEVCLGTNILEDHYIPF